ncbi:hypothetical protein HYN24_09160 [Dechloromonas sp. HYN0024]|nr:hypothetical protein HYN24_09160 [Dechloromonas sp. HYN0024]
MRFWQPLKWPTKLLARFQLLSKQHLIRQFRKSQFDGVVGAQEKVRLEVSEQGEVGGVPDGGEMLSFFWAGLSQATTVA